MKKTKKKIFSLFRKVIFEVHQTHTFMTIWNKSEKIIGERFLSILNLQLKITYRHTMTCGNKILKLI